VRRDTPEDSAGASELAEFKRVYTKASNDFDLLQVLSDKLGTCALSSPETPGLACVTYDIARWAVEKTRKHYEINGDRLKVVVSSAPVANAYAVWGRSKIDWIVLTEGLMDVLRKQSEALAETLAGNFPLVFTEQFMKRLNSVWPLDGCFDSMLGSLLYFGAICFFWP
jgi:hypothetical protein